MVRSESVHDKLLRLRALDQDSPEWLLARKEDVKLSASEMASAIGHPGASTSRVQLWRYKTGRVDSLLSPTPYLQRLLDHGKATEPEAIEVFASQVRPQSLVVKTGIWLLPSDVRIGATPDAVVSEEGVDVPLEVKCPYDADYVVTAGRRLKDVIQVRTQMECMNAPYAYLFYYHPDGLREAILVVRNASLWADIYDRACVFLHYVEQDEEPKRLSKLQLIRERDELHQERRRIAARGQK